MKNKSQSVEMEFDETMRKLNEVVNRAFDEIMSARCKSLAREIQNEQLRSKERSMSYA